MAIKKIVFLYDDGKTETYNGQEAVAFTNMMRNLSSLASAHGSQINWPVAEKGALPTHDAPEEFKHKEVKPVETMNLISHPISTTELPASVVTTSSDTVGGFIVVKKEIIKPKYVGKEIKKKKILSKVKEKPKTGKRKK